MQKKRVYQVAKEFNVSSEALLLMLSEMKLAVKSHMSVLEDDVCEKIKSQFDKKKAEATKDIQKQKEIKNAIEKNVLPEKIPQKSPDKKDFFKKGNPKAAQQINVVKAPQVAEEKTQEKVFDQRASKKGKEQDKKQKTLSRKQKKKEHLVAVQESFKKTMASIVSDSHTKSKKTRAKSSSAETEEEGRPKIKVSEFISVSELASQMGLPASTIISKCMSMGLLVSINQRLEMDTIVLLAEDLGYDIEQLGEYAEDVLKARDEEESAIDDKLVHRPPVVTVMGHVDHGKTTLLDNIRKSNVVSSESGGITQHIGAYSVVLPGGNKITFIDTPGHKAFTAMRARGAKVTDIVILVVAADDSVMPQTLEAIDHAKAAGVPIIIAINKIDLPGADVEKLKGDLARYNLLVEDWGGPYQCQEVSAKKGINIDKLLEKVLLEAEMLELKANPEKKASGVIIDSKIDRGRGSVATILIQSGTLRIGDPFIAGMVTGKIRAMFNEHGKPVISVGPSEPAQILGMDGIPRAGDTFYAVNSDIEAREISQQRKILKREQDYRRVKKVTLSDIYDKIKEGTIKELRLIIKADVDGSMEALADSLSSITHAEVRVSVIHQGVGEINENDVLLASASGAIIIGFRVKPSATARVLAETENVEIKNYEIIYEAIEEVQSALKGLLAPKITEKVNGAAEVRNIFRISRIGTIAGCYVINGVIKRNLKVRVMRAREEIYSGKIGSLKRFKDDVSEVNQGYECGIDIDGFNDFEIGDIIESIEIVKEARDL